MLTEAQLIQTQYKSSNNSVKKFNASSDLTKMITDLYEKETVIGAEQEKKTQEILRNLRMKNQKLSEVKNREHALLSKIAKLSR
jgi:16S rRNA C1402 (ribose-2'-O) methylase RsmI